MTDGQGPGCRLNAVVLALQAAVKRDVATFVTFNRTTLLFHEIAGALRLLNRVQAGVLHWGAGQCGPMLGILANLITVESDERLGIHLISLIYVATFATFN